MEANIYKKRAVYNGGAGGWTCFDGASVRLVIDRIKLDKIPEGIPPGLFFRPLIRRAFLFALCVPLYAAFIPGVSVPLANYKNAVASRQRLLVMPLGHTPRRCPHRSRIPRNSQILGNWTIFDRFSVDFPSQGDRLRRSQGRP